MEYLIGLGVGVIITIMSFYYFPTDKVIGYDMAIELCEKDLPRNQTCVITAIVKESE